MDETAFKQIIAHTLPGVQVRSAQALGERSFLLTLSDGRRVVLRSAAEADEWAGDPLAAEAGALQVLRGEIDLPLAQRLAYAADGEPIGQPYLLLSYLEGQPLPDVIDGLSEEQRYAIGRELGALMARVHLHTASSYGILPTEGWSLLSAPAEREPQKGRKRERNSEPLLPLAESSADVDYLRSRLTRALTVAEAAGEINPEGRERLLGWLDQNVAPTNQRACLVHGDLRPERILLRRRDNTWRIAGLIGWSYAQTWRPNWDHVNLLETCASSAYFSLRVGYGNAYDAATNRTYDQLRDLALHPYRLVLYLEAGRADLAVV